MTTLAEELKAEQDELAHKGNLHRLRHPDLAKAAPDHIRGAGKMIDRTETPTVGELRREYYAAGQREYAALGRS